MTLLVQAFRRALADDRDHRCPVHVRIRDSGEQVGHPGSQRTEANAGLAGEPAVGIRHERRGLFVPAKHEVDFAVQQGDHEIGVFLAGNTVYPLHAFFLETAHHQI